MVVLRFADIGGIVEHHCFHSMEDNKLIIRINFNYKKQVLLTLREHPISPRLFGGVRVANLFNFLCYQIMCLYVLSCVVISA